MIKGFKHYFTMFGVLRSAINIVLHKFFTQINELNYKYIPIQIMLVDRQEQTLKQNQTYQG